MAPPYSNTNGNGNSNGYGRPYYPRRNSNPLRDDVSLGEEILAGVKHGVRSTWSFARGPGRRTALAMALQTLRQVRRNLAARRLLSFPHLLVGFWVFVLLWGERWVFHSKVESCSWKSWEKWPTNARPHHLVFVADPQIIDAHSYPGRPWPLSSLTVLITDNYLRRSYNQLQSQLEPDSIFFLGDLFDGGREWKTAHGQFGDPEWAKGRRPANEQKHLKKWHKKYGEDYWLREYARFGDIFLKPWLAADATPRLGQRGKKLVASLPGNHDLGFGSEVNVAVRDRFEAYFGDANRVDVVGNHTIVSVDTVSLSARSSEDINKGDLKPIYMPAELWLKEVQATKRKAVEKELRFWRGESKETQLSHKIEEVDEQAEINAPSTDPGPNGADFPTILLTHVPLYRDPGTPCGPMREHWPPTKPPKGQTEPVVPDHRNAISVSRGYQYQNVLSEQDSVRLVKDVGNVVHVFSGDDHDYCELVHSESQGHVKEITVKSISMAMGVPTPGFLMVSLYNPVDADGRPLPDAPKQTLQTHLCLLPNQLSTFITYLAYIIISVLILVLRAFLVPALGLQPFALEQESTGSLLPSFKHKRDDRESRRSHHGASSSGSFSSNYLSSRFANDTRTRSSSMSSEGKDKKGKGRHAKQPGRWGWAESRNSPRIEIRTEDFYDGGKSRGPAFQWRAATARSRQTLGTVGREIWTTVWRVAWMVVLVWSYLAYKG